MDKPTRSQNLAMRLFFARHGESEANLLRVISNRDAPHGLTLAGREQAFGLAAALRSERVVDVYASPICRARETGEIVARELGAPLTIEDGLREFDCGIFEGRGDVEAWERHLWVQKRWTDAHDLDARLEGGESFLDIERRFRHTLNSTQAARPLHEPDAAILYISHGATLFAMLPLLLENLSVEAMLKQGLTYTTHIEVSSEGGALRCVRWNGKPYMSEE